MDLLPKIAAKDDNFTSTCAAVEVLNQTFL